MQSGETVEEAIIRLYTVDKMKKRPIRDLLRCRGERVTNAINYFEEFQIIPEPKKK